MWDSEYKYIKEKWGSDEWSVYRQPTRLGAYATYEAAASNFKEADENLKKKYKALRGQLQEIWQKY
jgi:hypothetical protein